MNLKSTIIFSLISSLPFVLQGCTILGMGVGSIVDSRPGDKGYLEIGNLKTGDKRYFSMRDGTVIKGEFIWMDTLDATDYRLIQTDLQDSLNQFLGISLIGDTLVGMDTLVIEKFEYTYRQQTIRPSDYFESQYLTLVAKSLRNSRIRRFCLSDIEKLTFSNGKTLGRPDLMKAAYAGFIPLNSRAIIKTDSTDISLNLNDIKKTSRVKTHKGLTIGLLTGLFLDLAALAIMAAVASSSEGLYNGGGW